MYQMIAQTQMSAGTGGMSQTVKAYTAEVNAVTAKMPRTRIP